MPDMPKEDVQERPKRGATFYVHNTARARNNRTVRAAGARHGGLKQFIGGEHRLVRGRPLAMTEERLMKHLPELKAKKKAGLIDVKDANGRSVDLDTRKLTPGAPPIVTPPLPQKPIDSIQNDKPTGLHLPQIAGGFPETQPPGQDGPQLPDLVATAPSEKEDEEDLETESDEGEEETGETPPPAGENTNQQPAAQQNQQRRGKKKKNR